MTTPLTQHQVEIRSNLAAWQRKPLLQAVYATFYRRLKALVDPSLPGRIAEIGSGIGNLRDHFPDVICTDLFLHDWIDLVCDGYELPFRDESISHLLLVDVFHHLEAPGAFVREARRVLVPGGRVLVMDPCISWLSYPIYGLIHHEPVAWSQPIRPDISWPPPRAYYAAQGNATRLFFRSTQPRPSWLAEWKIMHAEPLAGFAYLASGGFSGPSLAPRGLLPLLLRLDQFFSRWPRLFAVRCLLCLQKPKPDLAA